ncbi:Hypothetical protein HVR_LOCUS357 [uncultured virus]|nr:Hypothetical protein HVR_LOCUS357 [uncultured virus]
MALLGVTKIPTIIVNAFDIMWYDVDIQPNDTNPFFFKNNPFNYLLNLENNGWTVHLYTGSVTDEIKRSIIPRRDPENYLTEKLGSMMILFEEFSFISETELPEIIANADPSSFAIIDDDRPFYPEIAHYSPIEIFELVDPPTIPLDAITYTVSTNNADRWADVINYIRDNTGRSSLFLSSNRNDRYEQLIELGVVDRPIYIVWSPIYRYTEDEDEVLYLDTQFDRPDRDNLHITVYVWGY